MSNYPPYQNNPVQRRPVPGQAQPQQQPQQPTPPPAPAAPPQVQAPYQQPTYQQTQPTPQTYQTQQPQQPQYPQYPQQPQQPQQYPQYQYGPPQSSPNNLAPGDHAPTLPPRPPGGAGPFLAKTYLSFPPPPRSPNRPPALPPRPQASPQPQPQLQPQQQQQSYAQPVYNAPAAPGSYAYNQQAYAQPAPVYPPAPPQAQSPAYSTLPAASATPSGASSGQPTTGYQQGYYPPPLPLPPQQQAADPNAAAYAPPSPPPPLAQHAYDPYDPYATQPAQTSTAPPQYTSPTPGHAFIAVDQKQPVTEAAPVPDPQNPATAPPVDNTQLYVTSYNYYDAQQAYPTPPSQPAATPASQHTPATHQYQTPSPQVQVHVPADAATVSPHPATASPIPPAACVSLVSPEHTGDPMLQMNSMLQSMDIASEAAPPAIPSEPVELLGSTGPESRETPQAAFQATPQATPSVHSPQPPPSAQAAPPAQPVAPAESAYAVYHPQQAQVYAPQKEQPPAPTPQPPVQPAEQPAAPQTDAHDRAYPDQQYAPTNYVEAQYAAATPAPPLEPPRHVDVDPPFRPVISCIDTPMAFNTWWYTHPSAPEAFICSKCYMDYLYPTQFQNHFGARYLRDGVRRRCRFKVARITDQLLHDAQATGSVQGLIDFMNQRLAIPDCKKLAGAKGGQGLKWFRAKHDAIPGMVVCEACFLDVACISPFAYNFEPSPPHDNADDVWSCDLAVPFIRKEFDERSAISDWPSFCNEAKARLGMLACPKTTPAMISLRKWFTPIKGQGPPDAVLCAACYCDRILKTGQEKLWENMPRDPIFSKKYSSECCAGQFHILMALSAAEENKTWPLFWRSLNKIAYEEKVCAAVGIKDGHWFTLPSQPAGFQVCGACYAGHIESLGLTQFFVPQIQRPPADTAVICSLNVKAPRFAAQVDKMLETWFTQDCASWETFMHRYGQVPPCCRDEDYSNRGWYGWPDCTICAECYLEFVKGTALDNPASMPMHTPQIIADARICEMYSPRMRALYTEACAQTPTNPAALLAYSVQRRIVYWETMPICRNILIQEKFLASNIAMARLQSVSFTGAGNIVAAASTHHDHTYGQAGVGYGFDNTQQLAGARYNVQADQMAAQMGGNKILVVGQLEQRWKSVE